MASVSKPLKWTIKDYAQEWLRLFTTNRIIYIVYTFPLLLLWKRKEGLVSALPWLSAMFFMALAIHHANYGYYITTVGPFSIFAMVSLIM